MGKKKESSKDPWPQPQRLLPNVMSDTADTNTQTAAPVQDININSKTAFSFITVLLIYELGFKTLTFAHLCSCWPQFLWRSISKEVETMLDVDTVITTDQDTTDSHKKFLQSIVDAVTGQFELPNQLIRIFEVCILLFVLNNCTPCYYGLTKTDILSKFHI